MTYYTIENKQYVIGASNFKLKIGSQLIAQGKKKIINNLKKLIEMKKFKLASITILAVFLVTMQSCKKDEIEENNDVSKEITNQKQTRSSEH